MGNYDTPLPLDYDGLKKTYETLRVKCEQTEAALNERLKVEEELRESRERFETIFHQSNVAHKIINRDLDIIELNEAMAQLLGYPLNEILGTKIMDYTHPDFKGYWQDLQIALWKEEVNQFQLEACLITKDGSQAWVIVHTILFKDQGEKFGYTLLEDITTRKQLEHHKDEFISVISHELKTPMTSLKAQCQLMVRHLKKYEDAYADKMMAGIDKQLNRLTRFIHNLVLVSKIDSSKLQPEVNNYHLNEVISEVIEEIRLTAPKRTITSDITGSLPVKGDADKIYQVVYNLLTNAIKFSESSTAVHVTMKRQQSLAVVCIQDHGQGIPKENLEKIFERFYKVETPSSSVESGIGLGLFISSEIINHQNGRLWVESEPGKGSTFCFRLPILED
ncbi:PAS domain-containing sensor histidine kinase [Mucilaginibacter sp. PAMB04274]|uniref:PAS domain-containing sensor histidine kinase n=1 Tax=Mucilaginibacter sp. PAMB04274 TaxID=3138568 RepID=UPI0031F61ACA